MVKTTRMLGIIGILTWMFCAFVVWRGVYIGYEKWGDQIPPLAIAFYSMPIFGLALSLGALWLLGKHKPRISLCIAATSLVLGLLLAFSWIWVWAHGEGIYSGTL